MNFMNPNSTRWLEFPYHIPASMQEIAPQLSIFIGDSDTELVSPYQLADIMVCGISEVRLRLTNTGGQFLSLYSLYLTGELELVELPSRMVLGAGESTYITVRGTEACAGSSSAP
jgi:hypothetical protein